MMAELDALAASWFTLFGWMTLQNTLFLLGLFLLLRALKRAPASLRYAAACAGLVKLVLPPINAPDLIGWHSQMAVWISALSPLSPVTAMAVTPQEVIIWKSILFLVWLGIALFWLVIPLGHTLDLWRTIRRAEPVSDPALAPSNIRLYQSREILFPVSLGLWQQRMILPGDWRSWPDLLKRSVIAHERAHLERHDSWMQLFQIGIQALYFFHPLVWLLNRKITEYREMACDDAAIRHCEVSPRDYVTHLFNLIEGWFHTDRRYTPASTFLRGYNQMVSRMNYQLAENPMKQANKRMMVITLSALCILFIVFSAYRPRPVSASTALHTALHETTPAAADDQKPVQFDKEPSILKQVQPVYPEAARKAGAMAKVGVELLINREGKVTEAKVLKVTPIVAEGQQAEEISGFEKEFSESTLAAVRSWVFKPAEKEGKVVEARVATMVMFKLH